MADKTNNYRGSSSDAVYGLGFIGALIYFISTASSFWMGLLGILKAIVWPAYLVFEALQFFLM
jgi:predicted small integral membrane protein